MTLKCNTILYENELFQVTMEEDYKQYHNN